MSDDKSTPLVTDVPPARARDRIHVYRCSECGGRGHNSRTCGQTPEQRRASRRGRR